MAQYFFDIIADGKLVLLARFRRGTRVMSVIQKTFQS